MALVIQLNFFSGQRRRFNVIVHSTYCTPDAQIFKTMASTQARGVVALRHQASSHSQRFREAPRQANTCVSRVASHGRKPFGAPFAYKDAGRTTAERVQASHGSLPFRLAELRDLVPEHCWCRDGWRSVSYLLRDVVLIVALTIVACAINEAWCACKMKDHNCIKRAPGTSECSHIICRWFWLPYWFAQGVLFWALFAIGHDWWVKS